MYALSLIEKPEQSSFSALLKNVVPAFFNVWSSCAQNSVHFIVRNCFADLFFAYFILVFRSSGSILMGAMEQILFRKFKTDFRVLQAGLKKMMSTFFLCNPEEHVPAYTVW